MALWFGAYMIDQGEMNFERVIRSFFSVVMAAVALGVVGGLMPDFQKGRVAAVSFAACAILSVCAQNHIFKLLDSKSQIDALSEDGDRAPLQRGEIVFENVHFAYPTRPTVP